MNPKNQANQIKELLTKGVENIYPNREFLEKLLKLPKLNFINAVTVPDFFRDL